MKIPHPPTKCFAAALSESLADPALRRFGFASGIIMFSIPELGLLFRCRAEGGRVALERAAFFTLLEFIDRELKAEKITSLDVRSSCSKLVFSFASENKDGARTSHQSKLLGRMRDKYDLSVSWVDPSLNRALLATTDLPALKKGLKSNLSQYRQDLRRLSMKPLQRGVKLP
jgi:hypothetical protein